MSAVDAEFVAFRIGEHDTARAVFEVCVRADSHAAGRAQSADLVVDVAGVGVQVHPVLAGLRFRHLFEEQLGSSSGGAAGSCPRLAASRRPV